MHAVYPFAKHSNCFLIKTINDEEFCFEAKSLVERERLVCLFKMVIDRFCAKVLVVDKSVYAEFFATAKSCVPGKAPCMLPGLHDWDDDWDNDSIKMHLHLLEEMNSDEYEMFDSCDEEC
jgi:hypothetical protein